MKDSCNDSVVTALARHLDVDALAIEPAQSLEEDWGLDALDLVLVATTIEEDLEMALPFERLAHVRTVGDLVLLVRSTRYTKHRDGASRRQEAERWLRRLQRTG